MGARELEREYNQLTAGKVKPASASTNLPGPLWALSDWIFTGRSGVSLFATGLGILAIGIFVAIAFALAAPFISGADRPLILSIGVVAMQATAGVATLIGLLTMLAAAIRIGTNADHRANDRNPPA